jgi:hypothetical protein
MFGYKLMGAAAVAAKNVYLPPPANPATLGALAAALGRFGDEPLQPAVAAPLSALSAPCGMHAPLFHSTHPPRLPTALCGPHSPSARTALARPTGPTGSRDAAQRTASGGAGAASGGQAAASVSESLAAALSALDSVELLGPIASRDGGRELLEGAPEPPGAPDPNVGSGQAAAAGYVGAAEAGAGRDTSLRPGRRRARPAPLAPSAAPPSNRGPLDVSGRGGSSLERRQRLDCQVRGQLAVRPVGPARVAKCFPSAQLPL